MLLFLFYGILSSLTIGNSEHPDLISTTFYTVNYANLNSKSAGNDLAISQEMAPTSFK